MTPSGTGHDGNGFGYGGYDDGGGYGPGSGNGYGSGQNGGGDFYGTGDGDPPLEEVEPHLEHEEHAQRG